MDQIFNISEYSKLRTPVESAFHNLGFVFDNDAAEAFQELVRHWQRQYRSTIAIYAHAEGFLDAFGGVFWPPESAKRQHLELEDPDQGLTYLGNRDVLRNKMVHYCSILSPLLTKVAPGSVKIDEEVLIERIVQRMVA